MQLIENKNIDLISFYSTLQEYFPKSELKDIKVIPKILDLSEYNVFDIYNENNIKCGFITIFEFPDNTFLIDYFVIFKEFHSQGYGSKVLNYIKTQPNWKGCYLEVEKENPLDKNTTRRIKFYEKLGAKLLDINYLYPNNFAPLPMNLYFLPIDKDFLPTKRQTLNNIKILFEKVHFDIKNINLIYKQITD